MSQVKMMRLQRLSWLIPVILITFVVLSFFVPVPCHPSRVTWKNFDCIQDGMTEAEVEEILGPSGSYRHNRTYIEAQHGISFRRYWYGDEAIIIIEVTWPEDGGPRRLRRVDHKEFHRGPSESYGEQWCRQLWCWAGRVLPRLAPREFDDRSGRSAFGGPPTIPSIPDWRAASTSVELGHG